MASAIKHIFGFGGQQQPTVINARRLRLLPGPATGRNSPRPTRAATPPSFMSAAATPQQQNTSNKTLLGR